MVINSAIFIPKKVPGLKEWSDIRSVRGGVSYIDTRGKKAPERRSGLCPSEKEHTEQRSDAFRHKNTPGYNHHVS
jgi:hypothetical protein